VATIVNHYRLRCTTEGIDKFVWGTSEPTTCPTDTAHTIDASTISVVESTSTEKITIVNDDGDDVNFPMTSAKTPIYQPNIIPAGYLLYLAGAFDDLTGSGTRGAGAQIHMSKTENGEATLEGQFYEHVYVLGGMVGSTGADLLDWMSFEVFAPASAPEDRTATNNGNANKSDVGGFNIIVPAPGNDGAWNVDGATLQVGEINQNFVPVPNSSGTGYWNWDCEANPSITPVANPGAPDGKYDLFDAQLPLARQANRVPVIPGGEITPPTLKGKKILPHWKWKFTLHRQATGTVEAAACLWLARLKTT
jgi:hypothetical protein